jgi:hypothetical protein
MARQKFYIVMAGVMRTKWIDPKDVHDVNDKPFTMPVPPVEERPVPVKVENPKILMVADEPGGPRHPVDRETGKPVAEEEAAKEVEAEAESKAQRKHARRGGKRR